jgi:hypothetical protein
MTNQEINYKLSIVTGLIHDYCDDLNMLHVIENELSAQERIDFVYALNDQGLYSETDMIFASPKERAIAYLKAKWRA